MNQVSISVVIPAYNEELYIERCIISLERELIQNEYDFEIIIVNDASKDKTAEIVEKLRESRAYLHLINNAANKGLGGSLREGFAACKKELIFYSDADLPFDFIELNKAVRVLRLKDADMVLGFRHDRTDEGIIRIIYSFFYNVFLRFLFGISVKDINFSFKLMRRDAISRMNLKSSGSFIDAEIIIKAHRMKLFFCQIGIDYLKRKYGESTLSGFKVILKILKEIAVLYPEIRNIKPVKIQQKNRL